MNKRYSYYTFMMTIGETAKSNWFAYVSSKKSFSDTVAERHLLETEFDAKVGNEGGQRYYYISDESLTAFLLRFG